MLRHFGCLCLIGALAPFVFSTSTQGENEEYAMVKVYPSTSSQVEFLRNLAFASFRNQGPQSHSGQSEFHQMQQDSERKPPLFITPLANGRAALVLVPSSAQQHFQAQLKQQHLKYYFEEFKVVPTNSGNNNDDNSNEGDNYSNESNNFNYNGNSGEVNPQVIRVLLYQAQKLRAPFTRIALARIHGGVIGSSRPGRSDDVAIYNTAGKAFRYVRGGCENGHFGPGLLPEHEIPAHSSVIYEVENRQNDGIGILKCEILYKSVDGTSSFRIVTNNQYWLYPFVLHESTGPITVSVDLTGWNNNLVFVKIK